MLILSDDAIKSATLTATSTASGFSVNNIKNDKRSSTWRSTAITSQTITATWASSQAVNMVGIAFANFLVGSTVRVRLFTNTGDASPVVDSGVKTIDFVYPPPSGFSANNLSSFAYGGGNYYSLQVTQSSIKKLEVIMVNPSGVDAFIEVSRIVAGAAFNPAIGARLGANIGMIDTSRVEKTDSGNTIMDRRPASKTADFTLPALSTSERATMQAIVRKNGIHTPVFISARESGDTSMERDFQIYGTFDDLSPMTLFSPGLNSYSMKIIEV